MDLTDQINSYFTRGYAVFEGLEYHLDVVNSGLLETTRWVWTGEDDNDWYAENNQTEYDILLYNIHQKITDDIVSRMFTRYSVDKRKIWSGVNWEATEWHNDISRPNARGVGHQSGTNCFFLLYHSLMETDGSVFFRNTVAEWELKPRPGLLVAVNCDNNYEHRADTSIRERIQSSYYFKVEHGWQY